MSYEENVKESLIIKSLHIDIIFVATSLTKIRNKSGSNTDPWGTFADTTNIYDNKYLYKTF